MIQSQHLDYETGMITVEITLREQYPNTQFIQIPNTHFQIRENTDQKNSVFGQFLCSAIVINYN